jgi:hypothetical protein
MQYLFKKAVAIMENTNKKYLRPQIMNIPHQLKALPQWVLWRIETRNGDGPTKVPYTAFNGRKAKPNDPKTWAKFSAIKTAYKQEKTLSWDGTWMIAVIQRQARFNPALKRLSID